MMMINHILSILYPDSGYSPYSLSSISRQSSVKSAVFGEGRTIPVKEGFLYKKSSNWKTSSEWTSKYVALTTDGTLSYFPSYSAYLDETGGKTVELRTATVKLYHSDNGAGDDKYFEVITLDQQRWVFACKDASQRSEWVQSIKQEIKSSLQVRK